MIDCRSIEDVEDLLDKSPSYSAWRTINQVDINNFSDLTGDHQWIHVDEKRASQDSPFGGTIAHGFLTLSLLPALFTDAITLHNRKSGLNYGFDRLRFVSPVNSGTRVRGKFFLTKAQRISHETLHCTWNAEVEIENYNKPAIASLWITRYIY